MPENLLDPSSRVALAAMLHDLGKFAERARLECDRERLEIWKQLDCPHWDGRPSHIHAAYTTAGFTAIEHLLPVRERMMALPFASPNEPDADDSLINAAARHHRPDTFLQWIIATADRLASGFERSEFEHYNRADEGTATGRNHYQARLLPLFESIAIDGSDRSGHVAHCLPLQPLSPQAIFPQPRTKIEPADNRTAQAEYAALWQSFVTALERIPHSHRDSLPLWLDHFDAAWLAFTHAIPSATAGKTRPDVSLYDHSKAVAALSVALWRWHEENGKTDDTATFAERADWDEPKLLLIQGDFSGIQDFIFADGGQTQAKAARLLRGRSFQVSLLTELAALTVLETLALPPTSQIINAAGKFLIVAPNTPATLESLAAARCHIDAWCLEQTFGESSLQIVALPATCNDFMQGRFDALMRRLFDALEAAKLARFGLCDEAPPAAVRVADFGSIGPCAFDGRRPAQTRADDKPASLLAADQITIGKRLADPAYTRILIAHADADVWTSRNVEPLDLDYFGYRIAFARNEDAAGRFGELAAQGALLRCWDFSLPALDGAQPLFQGYARRDINAYIPIEDKEPVTLDEVAKKDEGVTALAILKGDVDHLGAIFQQGIRPATFARMAAVSRQTNAFFAIHLPWLCRSAFPYTYTVFAGGDDFFLIGPWHQTQALARKMRGDFAAYAATNPQITFSAGLCLAKPGHPIRALAADADEALTIAKESGRDRITSHSITVTWSQFDELAQFERQLDEFREHYKIGTGFIYRLLHLAEKAASGKPEDAIWQSWLAYRVRRFVVDKMKNASESTCASAQAEIAGTLRQAIASGKLATRIAISNHLYRHRD